MTGVKRAEPPVGTVLRDRDGRVFVREARGWMRTGSRAETQWRDLHIHYGPMVRLAPVAEVAEDIAIEIIRYSTDVLDRTGSDPMERAAGAVIIVGARIAREYAEKEG
jgi:hypothetical protein